ncbi:YjcZ family sporulation protein [Bacillus paramycoides]|nr:YjcZ family sporulation protein [Bacillus paramycoides]
MLLIVLFIGLIIIGASYSGLGF